MRRRTWAPGRRRSSSRCWGSEGRQRSTVNGHQSMGGPVLRLAPSRIALILAAVVSLPASSTAQSIAGRVEAVLRRPALAHAMAGVEFYDLAAGKAVYRLNGDKFFVPASTTKLLTVGTALELLGPDYRVHTRGYRTGPIAADGTLEGDLVLVASGDPNLSGRIRPDGTLAFRDEDHSYAGEAVEGDPLLVIRELAGRIAAKGIKQVRGRERPVRT